MRRLRTFVTALTVGAVVLGAGLGAAEAQTEAARALARQRYAQAQALFDSGQFAPAEAAFRSAYEAVPNPVVLRAIAAAQERQGNTAGAAQTLQQYLRDSPAATDRAEVERRIAQMTPRPASVAISSTPPGAQVLVDGRQTGQVTPVELQLPAGDHTVELRAAGYTNASQRVTVTSGARSRVDVRLTAGAAFGAGGDGRGAGGGGGGGGGSEDPSIGVWIAAGVGAAGLISGTVFGFLALSEQSNFDAQPSHDAADRGETFALVADISFGIAAAGAITAVVLYIVERSMAGSADRAGRLDGDRLQLGVSPWADPNGGGVAAQLRF